MVVQREERFKPRKANDVWSLDFVSDEFGSGHRFRALTVVDVFTGEALAIDVGVRLRGEDVVRTLNRLVAHAKEVIEHWRLDYNESRPHMALGNVPPSTFALQARISREASILSGAGS